MFLLMACFYAAGLMLLWLCWIVPRTIGLANEAIPEDGRWSHQTQLSRRAMGEPSKLMEKKTITGDVNGVKLGSHRIHGPPVKR